MPPASAPLMAANAAEWGGGEGEGWIAAEAIEVAASAVPASTVFKWFTIIFEDIMVYNLLVFL